MAKQTIDCLVLLFFGTLISIASLFQIINHKKGFEKDIHSYENLISFLRKHSWLALIWGVFFQVLGILFLVGAVFCLFESETRDKGIFLLFAGLLMSTISLGLIMGHKRAFEGYIGYLAGRVAFMRKHPGLALYLGIFFEAVGIALISLGIYGLI
jgi:hypothetical protein